MKRLWHRATCGLWPTPELWTSSQPAAAPLYAKAEVALTTTGKTPEQNLTELLRIMAVPDTRMARAGTGVSPAFGKARA
jgi:hypothetical protein